MTCLHCNERQPEETDESLRARCADTFTLGGVRAPGKLAKPPRCYWCGHQLARWDSVDAKGLLIGIDLAEGPDETVTFERHPDGRLERVKVTDAPHGRECEPLYRDGKWHCNCDAIAVAS